MRRFALSLASLFTVALSLVLSPISKAAELVTLTPETWDQIVPAGKEVDAIYGDYVLRNNKMVAVIARPIAGRKANMTVNSVGGAIIDLTVRDQQSDQLSAFYPTAARYAFQAPGSVEITVDGKSVDTEKAVNVKGRSISWSCSSLEIPGRVQATIRYTLREGAKYLRVETTYKNPSSRPLSFDLTDAIRADGSTFGFGTDAKTNLFWAAEDWFGQAYGVVARGYEISKGSGRLIMLDYGQDGSGGKGKIELAPGATYKFETRLIPGSNLLAVRGVANEMAAIPSAAVELKVIDRAGAIRHAKITVKNGDKVYGSARTSKDGRIAFSAPIGVHRATIEAQGRPPVDLTLRIVEGKNVFGVNMQECGYVVAEITDDNGKPIPCKIEFQGKDGTATPFFGPDAASGGAQNLRYTHDGKFQQELSPGKYNVIVSHGPEYDASFQEITIRKGQKTKLAAKLKHSVDTTGWISADFHSHSTPSGDNTGDQLGRVLNLLAEHIEFAPCTEHNRIDSYTPHLKRLNVEHLMATCTGIELTGNPLPVNHQNAFPLIHKPRMQDGGGPLVDINPVVQIERLAMWDGGAEKLVQSNHPNLPQILGDRDLNNKFDGGFKKMFDFMDVIEVHPAQEIFNKPTRDAAGVLKRNPIYHWMQMLNLGYRIPGVVNTDAHYNFHGSCWYRNYLKSDTDDPAKVKTMDMVHTSKRGQVVMTNGPFMEVSLKTGKKTVGPGEDVEAKSGKATLHVRIQCPNWTDVNRVQVFLNGRATETLNFTRRGTPKKFGGQPADVRPVGEDRPTTQPAGASNSVKFDSEIQLDLKSDTHVIVATIGEGLKIGPVMGAKWGAKAPVAVSNPIFVDVDGGGFKPNEDLLDLPLPLK